MSERDLQAEEGVDQGSAAATAEGAGSGAAGDPEPGGRPDAVPAWGEQRPAPPLDAESDEARAARKQRGTGQQYEVGEG